MLHNGFTGFSRGNPNKNRARVFPGELCGVEAGGVCLAGQGVRPADGWKPSALRLSSWEPPRAVCQADVPYSFPVYGKLLRIVAIEAQVSNFPAPQTPGSARPKDRPGRSQSLVSKHFLV